MNITRDLQITIRQGTENNLIVSVLLQNEQCGDDAKNRILLCAGKAMQHHSQIFPYPIITFFLFEKSSNTVASFGRDISYIPYIFCTDFFSFPIKTS